ncbi:hypothetical protein KUCAC02_026258, partial [Chaenocephalus aceratus]
MIRQANYSGHKHPTGLDSAVSVRVLVSVSVEVSAGAEMSGPQQTSTNRFFAGYSNKRDGEASLDSSSPDFVPSVFMYTKQSQNPNAKMDRDMLSLPPLCHSRYILLSHLAMIQGVAQK